MPRILNVIIRSSLQVVEQRDHGRFNCYVDMVFVGGGEKKEFDGKRRSDFYTYLPKKCFSSNYSHAKHPSRSTVVRDGGGDPIFHFIT